MVAVLLFPSPFIIFIALGISISYIITLSHQLVVVEFALEHLVIFLKDALAVVHAFAESALVDLIHGLELAVSAHLAVTPLSCISLIYFLCEFDEVVLIDELAYLVDLQIEVAEAIDLVLSEESLIEGLGVCIVPLPPTFLLSQLELTLIFDCLPPAMVTIINKLSSVEHLLILIKLYAEPLSLQFIHHTCKYFPIGCRYLYISFIDGQVGDVLIGLDDVLILFPFVQGKLAVTCFFELAASELIGGGLESSWRVLEGLDFVVG